MTHTQYYFYSWLRENLASAIDKQPEPNESRASIKITLDVMSPPNEIIKKEYLFSWDEIPGNDDERIIEFLKDELKIEWAKSENISKIDDGKTIIVSNKEKSLSLKLNDEKTKVNLKIDDGRVDEFTVKTENGKLNIYKKDLPEKTIELYGPGDILGFDLRIVTRTDPGHNVGDFEPNYFPIIEFADPDFPWRFAPAKEDTSENLQPWIALIVLEDDEFKGERTNEGGEQGKRPDKQLPPVISGVYTSSLPDLSKSWRWAHVQVTGEANKEISDSELKKIMLDEPERIISRLMCARRLKSGTKYHAFVVPTFRCGRSVGLGKKPDEYENPLSYAWDKNGNKVDLPYYYKWEFRTGQRGDFEHLVRLLEQRPLTGVGKRKIKCEKLSDIQGPDLDLEGALCSPDTVFTQWGKDGIESEPFRKRLAELLNKPKADMASRYLFSWDEIPGNDNGKLIEFLKQKFGIDWVKTAEIEKIDNGNTIKVSTEINYLSLNLNQEKTEVIFKIDDVRTDKFIAEMENGKLNIYASSRSDKPEVVPPIYGRWHAARNEVHIKDDKINKSWLDELNLDPRHRIAASIGAKVIKDQQESLMISAWDQLGDVEEANEKLLQAQLGMASSKSIYKRLPQDEDLLRLTAPVFSKVQMDNRYTVQQHIQRRRVPLAICDPAFRRIQRPQGPIRKRQKAAASHQRLFERFSKGGYKVVRTHPGGSMMGNRTKIDTISTRVYEELDPGKKIIDRNKRILDREDPGIVMAHPTFPQPMYKFLQDISQELLLPGIEKIPQNTIGLLKTNRRFIEAYMCGLNHAFASELLWREYPTDQRGSYFRQFWDYSDYMSKESDTEENLEDIKPLAEWDSERLGSNEPENHPKEKLVLILRGDLLKKYPNAVIYAVEAKLNEKNERVPALPEFEVKGEIQSPVFSGTMQPDITFLGFNITEDEARGILFCWDEVPGKDSVKFIKFLERNYGVNWIKIDNLKDSKNNNDDAIVVSSGGYSLSLLLIDGKTKAILKIDDETHTFNDKPYTFNVREEDNKLNIYNGNYPYGWYFVIEERVSETRFGLDEIKSENSEEFESWDDLTWGHFKKKEVEPGDYLDGFKPDLGDEYIDEWNDGSANIAWITMQKPVRIIIHANRILP